MDFEKELKEVFDIDIWNLKDKYSSNSQKSKQELSTVATIVTKKSFFVDAKLDNKPIYSNNLDSDRVINIYISEELSINFLKNVIESLFFKTKVNMYKVSKSLGQQAAINIYQKDFISDEFELLSVESKKYILQKLYQYADFSPR
ncbi:chloroquine resistance protein [Allofrancisella frigidaquae]|uniref:Chloroquine resistance protein n=1 Tax=Allofrancisella frigidaquae TaxID=1085644 RepID=A0A6M3HYD3_9GAMM|nr:chloroquine resistance protein [Allofrancisella frigidaquae]QIV94676.1 chloroquine resistance protein [Allofrancisella frigidaquae]